MIKLMIVFEWQYMNALTVKNIKRTYRNHQAPGFLSHMKRLSRNRITAGCARPFIWIDNVSRISSCRAAFKSQKGDSPALAPLERHQPSLFHSHFFQLAALPFFGACGQQLYLHHPLPI
jgi:hypothetical protein